MSLQHAVLGLLSVAPASGYELAKHFEQTLPRVWHAQNPQLYPVLSKLAASGKIEVSAQGPRNRSTYALTPAGRGELRHWLVEVEPDRTMRSEVYLRAFLLTFALSAKDALEVLDREAKVWQRERDGLASFIAESEQFVAPHDSHMIAYDLTLRLADAMLGWCDETRRRIEARL
ncbi:PadR family transcriptional regulator [Actinocrispum wychmicini]|uniref:PadR family transcriptional regulator n=1 Tax=Actinocrispum wychmicini TaxID=1213861 RepID=UPI0014054EE5|nr:PadR family transcriptional regulator [Actinocrispum wychmicini]